MCVIKSSIVLVFQVYPPLYKEYNFTNFSILAPSYSHNGSVICLQDVFGAFLFIASLSVFKGEASDYEEEEEV